MSEQQRYEIREAIGQGGLGSVFKAFDTQLQREVAMKRVLTTGQGTEDEVRVAGDKLIAEAQTLSSLNHPNIVTVFDVGRDDKGGFVVMELLEGETLDDTVERGVLTGEDFKEVVFQTMEGLIAAQAVDVIHRDIKPTNIMLIWQASGRFQLKILDFGLAKFSKNPSVQTMDQDEAVMGSIFFMAPEQFERAQLDSRTDLYQMGCVYYNALTGQYPFNGETAPQVMNAHLQHKVVPLEQLRPDLPPVLCQWVMWLINREISSRPANAKEALKFFPKDLSAAPALPVQSAKPSVKTPNIKIATPTGNAKAPPKLVTGLPMTTGTQTIQTKRPSSQTSFQPVIGEPSKKGLSSGLLTAIICGSLFALVVLIFGISRFNSSQKVKRLVEISELDVPSGSNKDVSLLVGFLAGKNSTIEQQSAAYKALLKFEGDKADPLILQGLEEAPTASSRVQLATILSQRGYVPAMSTLLQYAEISNNSKDQISFLRAAEPLARVEEFDALLANFKKADKVEIPYYQRMLAGVVRNSPRTEKQILAIQNRIASSDNDEEKRSLYGLLGMLSGKQTKSKLEDIFSGSNNKEKELAFSAFTSWSNRNLLGLIEKIILSNNPVLKRPAQHLYITSSLRPGPVKIDQRIDDWKKAIELMNDNQQEQKRLIGIASIKYPHPKTLRFLDEWKKKPPLKAAVDRASNQQQTLLKKAPTIQPSGKLKSTLANVTGSSGGIDRSSESIVHWKSPETYFTWTFKPGKSGEYTLLVEQSDNSPDASEFVLYLNGATFNGKSKNTKSYDDYQIVATQGKKVKLEANTFYHLTLAAGEKIQPRMMNVRSVILKKQ